MVSWPPEEKRLALAKKVLMAGVSRWQWQQPHWCVVEHSTTPIIGHFTRDKCIGAAAVREPAPFRKQQDVFAFAELPT